MAMTTTIHVSKKQGEIDKAFIKPKSTCDTTYTQIK